MSGWWWALHEHKIAQHASRRAWMLCSTCAVGQQIRCLLPVQRTLGGPGCCAHGEAGQAPQLNNGLRAMPQS